MTDTLRIRVSSAPADLKVWETGGTLVLESGGVKEWVTFDRMKAWKDKHGKPHIEFFGLRRHP